LSIVILYTMEGITMGKPLPIELRVRIAGYVAKGHSRRAAAKVFSVGASSAIRYVARQAATGTIEPAKQGGDRRSKLKDHRDFLLCRVAEVPDITLKELTAELAARGVEIHPSNVSRFLSAEGLTFKKNGRGGRTKTDGRLAPT
jgi:transposase